MAKTAGTMLILWVACGLGGPSPASSAPAVAFDPLKRLLAVAATAWPEDELPTLHRSSGWDISNLPGAARWMALSGSCSTARR